MSGCGGCLRSRSFGCRPPAGASEETGASVAACFAVIQAMQKAEAGSKFQVDKLLEAARPAKPASQKKQAGGDLHGK